MVPLDSVLCVDHTTSELCSSCLKINFYLAENELMLLGCHRTAKIPIRNNAIDAVAYVHVV
jgi:hypothetical protein